MKFRTTDEAHTELKELDPKSSISVFLIRKMAQQEKIRSLKTGCKIMVDVDSLIAYLKGEEYEYPAKMLILD